MAAAVFCHWCRWPIAKDDVIVQSVIHHLDNPDGKYQIVRFHDEPCWTRYKERVQVEHKEETETKALSAQIAKITLDPPPTRRYFLTKKGHGQRDGADRSMGQFLYLLDERKWRSNGAWKDGVSVSASDMRAMMLESVKDIAACIAKAKAGLCPYTDVELSTVTMTRHQHVADKTQDYIRDALGSGFIIRDLLT